MRTIKVERPYANDNNVVNFFIGTEVEHTPAHGMKTLFVVGLQSAEKILQVLNDPFCQIGGPVEHVYFGANMSFPKLDTNDWAAWTAWENMIMATLDAGLWCTLDIDHQQVEGLLESGLTEQHRFIPMISVKLPYIKLLGYNTTVKLDDRTFDDTNPGVWCHSLHRLMDRQYFTDWSKYTKDTVIG